MTVLASLDAAPTPAAPRKTMIEAIRDALAIALKADESTLVLGEDVAVDGGVFRATESLVDIFGPKRVIDTPVAESGIVGFSVGLALAGFRPIAEIQFMGFVYPAVNQLLGHVARFRNRTRGTYHLPMVVRMPYGGGIHAPEHHSESYEAMFANTPGLKVVIPSTPYDAKGLLLSAIEDDDPVIFLEPKRVYRSSRQEVPEEPYTVPIGKANIIRAGGDVTVIAYGAMMSVIKAAADLLAAQKVSCELIDLRTITPYDKDTILKSVQKTGRAVVVHEGPKTAGFAAELVAAIQERAMLHLTAPILRVTGFDTVFPYAALERHYLPTPERVVQAVDQLLAF